MTAFMFGCHLYNAPILLVMLCILIYRGLIVTL